MKKPLSLNAFALSTLVTLSLLSAHRAQAAAITWNSPLTIAGDTDVSTLGTPVFAYDWNGAAGNTTVNGVTFTGTTTINGTDAGGSSECHHDDPSVCDQQRLGGQSHRQRHLYHRAGRFWHVDQRDGRFVD